MQQLKHVTGVAADVQLGLSGVLRAWIRVSPDVPTWRSERDWRHVPDL